MIFSILCVSWKLGLKTLLALILFCFICVFIHQSLQTQAKKATFVIDVVCFF